MWKEEKALQPGWLSRRIESVRDATTQEEKLE
jgi:hypothetical protein